ncbi:MAG: SLC13 family permease [Thermoanaerobacteraceae bacterium]|nr:SLC13 family permease [Thermoanaerobacteraceae bacterium]
MSHLAVSLKSFWQHLWKMHHQAKRLLRLDFTVMAEISASLSEDEKMVAKKVLPGGGSGGNTGDNNGGNKTGFGTRQKVGLFLGPILFLVLLLMPTPKDMSPEAQAVLASTAWVATWWITEAIPIPATSLMPIFLFPLTGAMSSKASTEPYANHLVFLFMGGFLIAMAMEKWDLHRRIALNIIRAIGTSPNRLVLGFMVATAFLSMWISNTATTMMMTPIALAVILQVATLIEQKRKEGDTHYMKEASAAAKLDLRPGKFNFGTALMLGIAYAASIGGVATIIGTPPNTVFVGVAKEMFGKDIGFAQWMMYGVPIAAVGLIITWVYLVKIAFPIKLKEIPGGLSVINEELRKLGPRTKQQTQIMIVFSCVAIAWILRSFVLKKIFPMIHDTTIAILGAVILFLIPVDREKGEYLLDWKTANKIPWGILLLFGGGLSIASGFKTTGLAEWIAMRLAGLEGASMMLIVLAVVTLTIFLTEVTSNTATATMLMPIMASMAIAMQVHPYALMITAATAASFAFMLPVATPPNAIVFGTGYITIPQMAKAGFWLNVVGIILITILGTFWLPAVWGIDFTHLPDWAVIK